ncbi:MAG: ATP-binding protein, partial [Candidatus Korarchaeota archaeon]|nr:ATP-binding protein [Candidatus Korarchaeota archaeon]
MSTASPSNYAQLLGLYRNPFLRSSIIELEDPTAIFSKQWIDDILDSLAAEAMSGVASAFVALTGPPGSGRSLRLHLLNYSYNTADLESIYQEISVVEGPDIIDDLLVTSYGVSRSITKSLKKVLLGMPESLTDEELQQLKTSPAEAGRMIIRSLDSVAPSALLLDDVHNMMYTDERWSFFFFEMIREIVSVMPEGILVVLAMSDEAYEELDKK